MIFSQICMQSSTLMPERYNMAKYVENRARMILVRIWPSTGSFKITVSRIKRPPGVPYHTFRPNMTAAIPTRKRKPNQLPIKLLNNITMRVGSGKETPKPANKVAKIGTTFQSNRMITPPATVKTPTG